MPLITWQLSDTPNEMLTRYATHHGDAHDPNADIIAAHAESDPTIFRAEMASDLEEVVHDHYHNIKFSLHLAEGQTVVSKITGAHYESTSSYISMTAVPTADGQGIDVQLEHACRQTDIDFVIDVELNPDKYIQETVIPAGTITAPEDHSNGGLHTGIFDEGTVYGLTMHMPAAVIDRRKSTMTFNAAGAGTAPATIEQLVGTSVTIPDGTGLSNAGSSFGGWNVVSGSNAGTHYNAGEITTMPEGDVVLEPAWGHIEAELEVGSVSEAPPPGNNLALQAKARYEENSLLDFTGVTVEGGGTVGLSDINSFYVIDYPVQYDIIQDASDPDRIKLTNVSNAVYARHVGAAESDRVAAYLVRSTEAGKYDMYVAGPGGVTAPEDSSGFFWGGDSAWSYDDTWATSVKSIDLSGLNTGGVKNMSQMFEFCLALTSITFGKNFDTSNVDNLSSMFHYCQSLQQLDVSGFDTQSATNMYSMFYYCSALRQLDVSGFNTEKVTNMSNMFRNMQYIDKLDVSSFNTSKVTDMSSMFESCRATEIKCVGNFVTSGVTNMSSMFESCRATEIKGVGNFVTSGVTNMSEMFSGCALKTLDLRSWDTSNVENFQGMFSGCYALTTLQLPDPFVTSKAKTLDNLFASDKVLTIPDVSNWDTSNVVGMSELFSGCEKLTSVDLTKWKTDNVASMYGMFKGCKALTELDLSSFNTANVTSMSEMFASCEKLKTLKVSDTFTTGKVTNMGSMFYSCKVLETIPDVVSHFDTSNVTSMKEMFSYCNALTNLSLQFNTSKVVDMGSMFLRSENLQTLESRRSV